MDSCGGVPTPPPAIWRMRRKKERAARRLRLFQRTTRWPEVGFEPWYADGTRFDLLPLTRPMWHPHGHRLCQPPPGKNLKVGICGAIRFPTGEFFFTHREKSLPPDRCVRRQEG